ncbi:MAG: hypothetical protein A3K67_03200 [Euryarchaeota archaeon RBG_16_62_10]|nr:MAG: hypothetical protein A3K67_03200 [Euryarchaeota archaeon RBG_16_62_10]
MGADLMPERLSEHPILAYLTFVMPMLLLLLGIVFSANVVMLIIVAAWLGVALVILFLPVSSDNGSSS